MPSSLIRAITHPFKVPAIKFPHLLRHKPVSNPATLRQPIGPARMPHKLQAHVLVNNPTTNPPLNIRMQHATRRPSRLRYDQW